MAKLDWDKKRREDNVRKDEELSLSPVERSKLEARWRRARAKNKIRKGGSKQV